MSKFQIRIQNSCESSSELEKEKPRNKFHTNNYYTIKENGRPIHIAMQLRMCICRHMIDGHRFVNDDRKAGKCDYPYCLCEEFIQGDVEIWDFSENYKKNDDRKYEGGLF